MPKAGGAYAGGAYMPPFGMYAIMTPRSAVPWAAVHSNPIAERSHTSQNDHKTMHGAIRHVGSIRLLCVIMTSGTEAV